MKLYQYTWIEMSGGFDQLCNIEASNDEKAEDVFMKFAKKHWKNPEGARENISVECIQDKYTQEYINKCGGIKSFLRELPIHFREE